MSLARRMVSCEWGRGGGSTFVLLAGGIWFLARSRHINLPTTIVTRFYGHTEFLRALGRGKSRVHNLNSNPEVCHTNILIPESQVALVGTSINTTKNRFRFCTHPTCRNTHFVPKPRLWMHGLQHSL